MELVVSMGLLAIIMVPIVGMLSTTHKVYNSQNDRAGQEYTRQIALDATSFLLRGASGIVRVPTRPVQLKLSHGGTATLEFTRGQITWTVGGSRQIVAQGLTDVRFTDLTNRRADTDAGRLLRIEVASRSTTQTRDVWSTTTNWIKPAI